MHCNVEKLKLNYKQGRDFGNVFCDAAGTSIFLKHQVAVLPGTNGSLIKVYLNDGTLKTPLKSTIENCERAYQENPDIIPRTELIATGYITADQKKHQLALIEQEFIKEATYSTLDHHLSDGWNKDAVNRVLDKFDIMKERHKTYQKFPKIKNYDKFFLHEAAYEKRWNAPVIPFCAKKLKIEGEGFLESTKICEKVVPASMRSELSKVTREFAARNVLVEGKKLTFDTELYGAGKSEMDFAVMTSQLLNRNNGHANSFIRLIDERYGHDVCEAATFELIGYRAGELLKNIKGVGNNKEDYHREQLVKAIALWEEIA